MRRRQSGFMLRLTRCLFTTGLLLFPAVSWAAPLLIPTDLNPGDTYQLVFVTSATRSALSSNIADYNTFVQNSADAAGIGIGGRLGDVTWSAIASTLSVHAVDNAVVTGPIYNLHDDRIAHDSNDLWTGPRGSLLNPILYNEFADPCQTNGASCNGLDRNKFVGSASASIKWPRRSARHIWEGILD